MALIFAYGNPKQIGLTPKVLGGVPEVIVEEAILDGYHTITEDDEWISVVPDPRSIVLGQIFNVTDDELVKLDNFNDQFYRQPVQIGEHKAQVYIIKPEYIREEYITETDGADMSEDEKSEFLATAMQRFKDICDTTDQVRTEFVDDIRFKAGMQWPEGTAQERQRDERPMQTINRIDNFINTVVNSGTQNPPSIKVRPVDTVTDPKTADVISGLMRHALNQGDSKTALDTAFDFAVSGGLGYVRARTDYCDDASFDQEIVIDRVENPCAIYFPLTLMKTLDYSDAPYAFVRQKMTKAEFKEKYPKQADKIKSFEDHGKGDDKWKDKDNIYLAEYFLVKEETHKLYLIPDENGAKFSETIPEGIKPIQERDVRKKCVYWYLMYQFDILESRKLPGTRIPIFPILGKEVIIDGEKHYVSLTRYLKEPQKMLNFWYSAFTEVIANAPKAPFLVEENQVAGHKDFWDNANKMLPYLPYKGTDLKGNLIPPPTRIAPPEVGTAILTGIQYASEFMKDISGLHDASLGATSNERTGKAIQARANQGALATYHYVNAYERCIRALGTYLIEIIPIIYDTPRAVRIVGEDMSDSVVLINQMHPDVEGTGRLYDVTAGKYSVVVTSGQSYDTRRQETQDMLGNLMQTNPQMSMVLLDIFAQVSDIPGADKIITRMKKFLNMQFPGLLEENEMGTPEEQLQLQLQQMTGDIQKLMQKSQADEQIKSQMNDMLGQLQKQLEDKHAEISARVQVSAIKAESDAYKAQMELMKEKMKQDTTHKMGVIDAATKLHISGNNAETPDSSTENEGEANGSAGYGTGVNGQ